MTASQDKMDVMRLQPVLGKCLDNENAFPTLTTSPVTGKANRVRDAKNGSPIMHGKTYLSLKDTCNGIYSLAQGGWFL